MGRNQKIVVTVLWGAAVLAMLGVVGTGLWARRQANADRAHSRAIGDEARLAVLFDAPSFSLTDQNGKTVTNDKLRGDVWVAMVFFSQCPGVCPMMIGRMTDLQAAVKLPDVKIVSFSIDPEHDTPEVMKHYAEQVEADQSRWYFLTGPKPTMFEVARGLGLAAVPAQGDQPITHTQRVLLIDRAGQIRGSYDTGDTEKMKQLAEDAKTLASEKRPAGKEKAT